ncbi:UDP-N-acetylmuramoyl-tripeptide--D-alanyl-D-alanine ligase [Kineococcus rhizosphaerae]|uniref:UDP-N-acetylmuramoyl-tripeptide--D-alanyl-D-alanine ligase n=1 Tax=Kineococcus rhizosphaerae TaxID=559628 RepID=A0A2T0R8M5_9ACTN|nr:UDP-N-acetylmuramoyl-tripeptide--D-alanyl-D-alanine ligase [Kineococcus rhizosphaerae]PRY17533.1 UDP-N-acetylmuramoyl-tripeptide--D-alanyl-D-alanine ligase [Kineococcus rhizosphaerae]
MIALTAAEVADLAGGRVHAGPATARVEGPVVIDSRAASPGSLFVALAGERVDGADYAAVAVGAGASAVLAERAVELPDGAALVLVDDVVAALGRLAAGVLDRLRRTGSGPLVVGVTGSQGKTTTKDLLAQVLPGPVVAPQGSFNNEIGAPLTVLRADAATRSLVVEMGARGIGHIAALCRTARPDVGVELVVGAAHAGEFGSLEATAQAKGELVEALPADGLAVLNADDERVAAMASRTRARVLTFGRSAHADVRAADVVLDEQARAGFRLEFAGAGAEVRLRLHGEHQVTNALAAAAVALGTGSPLTDVARALSAAQVASPGRMQVVERADGVTVVHDAYNANPDSMRAALKALVGMASSGGRERRTWAVLGEMLELGPASRDEHDVLGRTVVRLDVDQLLVVGRGARPIYTGAVMEGSWGEEAAFADDVDAALEFLTPRLRPGDVVLVKSSNGAGLGRLAETLISAEASQT